VEPGRSGSPPSWSVAIASSGGAGAQRVATILVR
jgi:hypothetical protein